MVLSREFDYVGSLFTVPHEKKSAVNVIKLSNQAEKRTRW